MSDLRDVFPAYTPEGCVSDWVATEFEMPVDHLDPLAVNCSHTSLLCLGYKSRIRRWCVRFVHHKLFQWFMIVVILLNALALALRDPGLQTNSALQSLLDIADYVFVSLFTAEMVMKIISLGLLWHPKSYLRHPWNILDAVVVVSGLVGLAVDNGNGVSVLRVIRVLRPLRAFNYIKTLRRLISRIISALPRLRDVFFLLIFMVWLFDIVGLHLFSGTLNAHCFANVTGTANEAANFSGFQRVMNDTLVCGSPGSLGRQCASNDVNVTQFCLSGFEAHATAYSFDNAAYGFLLAFKIVSKDNWTDDLRDLTRALGPYVFFYFLLATMFVGYFSVNLFLAVLENVFTSKGGDDDLIDRNKKVTFVSTLGANSARDLILFSCFALPSQPQRGTQLEAQAIAAAAAQQRTFADALDIADDDAGDDEDGGLTMDSDDQKQTFLEKLLRKKGWRPLQRVVNSIPYTLIVLAMVVFNAVVLGIDRLNNPKKVEDFVKVATYVLSLLFLLDAVLKLAGLGPSYFAQWMNVFDFILCVISIPDIVNGNNSKFTALRAFRVVRLLRVVQGWEELQLHLRCLVGCIVSVGSLCLLGFIVIYIYAILGFQLFGYDVPNQRFSFRTVFDSLITVFVGVTGENINNVADAVIQRTGLWTALYFLSLTLLGNFLFTTMFVAVILENFHQGVEEDRRLKEQSAHFQAIAAAAQQGFGELAAARAVQRRLMQKRVVVEAENLLDDGSDASDELLGRWESDESSDFGTEGGGVFTAEEGGDSSATPFSGDVELATFAPLAAESHEPTVELRRHDARGAMCGSMTTTFHRTAQQIEQNLGVRGMTHVFEQFARDAKLHKGTHIVGDCSLLAAASEVQVAKLREESDKITKAGRVNFAGRYAVRQFTRLRDRKNQRKPKVGDEPPTSSSLYVATFSRLARTKTIAEKDSQELLWEGRNHSSLACGISSDNKVRVILGNALKHAVSEWSLLLVTVLSSVLLALDNDRIYRERPNIEQLVDISDVVFVAIFWVEMLMKIFVLGVFRHPGAFFRSVWNCIDAFVTVTSTVALFYSPFKVFRALRVLRLLNLSFTLRVIISSLVSSLPGLASVLVLIAVLFLVYGVLGVALFQGFLRHCTDPAISDELKCVGNFSVEVQEAFSSRLTVAPRLWVHRDPSSSFDNIESALYTLFRLANCDGWFAIMYPIVDSINAHETDVRNASPATALYFISFIVFANFFTVKLFIGVMVEKFVENRERGQGQSLLTAAQRQWILVQKVELRMEVRGVAQRPSNRILAWAFVIATNPWFDHFFSLLIVANSILISAYFESMSKSTRQTFDMISVIFVALFSVEITLKIMAFGPDVFMRSLSNRLDFVVVFLSVVGVIIGNEAAVVRVFRVSRLLLLLRKMKGIQTLLVTFYHSLPEFANVAFVLGVLYFIFAIIGVALFGSLPKTGALDDVTNFDDVAQAFITLYVMMTQESWAEITDAIALNSPYAYPYAVLFMISVSWVFVNLLVTVVCDVFGEAEQTERLESSLTILDSFRDRWVIYDPKGTKLLPSHVVEKLLATLPSSVWDRSAVSTQSSRRVPPWVCILQQLAKLHIPIDGDLNVRYEDCVASIALRLFSITVYEAIDVSQRTVHGVRWKANHFSIHHQFAAKLLTRTVRKYLLTRRQRELEQQLKLLREEHAAFVQLELAPLRRSHQETTLLSSWLAQKLKKNERKRSERRASGAVDGDGSEPRSPL
jgi:hypothetical protein